ncbi:hypothetical protein BaRGS_00038305 [Batillaria attramentaria]|uniref:Nose resistant-to-fluoxetine protein N-terminal domain-containing protein n=1 Tax=Batillaria attramentaria TaxID=370345 RepID=A0ABD0J666_9CAEN
MPLSSVTLVIVLVAVPTRVSGSPSNGRPAISATCASQTDQLRAATTKKEEWAMKILDAYGKPGPGIQQQRLHWLGSYDECRAVRSPSISTPSGNHTSPWGGQYCLASLSLYPVNGVPGLSEAAVILALIGVEDVQCRPREIKLSTGAQIVLALLALLAIVVGGATVYDVYVTNFIRFTDTRRGQGHGQGSREELTCLHGIRVLSILWIMLGHTHFYATQVPKLENRRGFLNFLRYYLHRLWRLTPVYMLWLAIAATLSPHFGDGPLWPEEGVAESCHTTWWTNMLYINNFVRTDKLCLPWTWYLANDVQFYAVAPIFVFFLHLGGGRFDFMDEYYIKPYCRAAPYFLGLLTGYVLHRNRCELELTKFAYYKLYRLEFGTHQAIATACCLAVVFGTTGFASDDASQSTTSFYISMNHVVWGMGVAWLLFVCCTNNAGLANRLFSRRGWLIPSRLTYCVFLVHPVVIMVYYMSVRAPFFFSKFNIAFAYIGNVVLSYACAFLLHIGFEAPMMALERTVFKQ